MIVEWTLPALDDLMELRDYIAQDSAVTAQRFIGCFFEAAERLTEQPKMGRRVPEAERDDVRELMVEKYRLIYLLETDKVSVLTVIRGSRDLAGMSVKPWE